MRPTVDRQLGRRPGRGGPLGRNSVACRAIRVKRERLCVVLSHRTCLAVQFQKGKTDRTFPEIEGAKRMIGIQTTEILESDSPPYKHHTLEFMYDLSDEEFERY